MHVEKQYLSYSAEQMIKISPVAKAAYDEILEAIGNMVGSINNSKKKANSVSPIKSGLVNLLHENYHWEKEHHLRVLKDNTPNSEDGGKRKRGQGGGIDIYKEFNIDGYIFRVGIEFETGNVASVHRSINKLCMGLQSHELDMIFLILPVFNLSQYLTDRVANYEEIEAYFPLFSEKTFAALGFDAECYSPDFPLFEKGKDGNASKADG